MKSMMTQQETCIGAQDRFPYTPMRSSATVFSVNDVCLFKKYYPLNVIIVD